MKCSYKINGLDCPNCANKIETKLNEHSEIKKATLNYSKLTLSVVTDKKDNVKELIESIARTVEPDFKLLDINSNNKLDIKIDLLKLIIGIILCLSGMFIFKGIISKILIIFAYIILLSKVFIKAIKLLKKLTIDENLLICISCIGAYLTNNIHEGLMVIVLYDIGKVLEQIAVNNSRKSIADLMNIKPVYANKLDKDEIVKLNPEEIKVGDTIRVLKGEKIPLDGTVIKGESRLDTSSLTGEAKLLKVSINSQVLSGSINMGDVIDIKVTNSYNDSTVAKILELVENASDRKAKTETFVAKAAKIYTPTVLGLAILFVTISLLFTNMPANVAIYRALVFLVISCPCAIAISVPLSYFSGIGASSKAGILIKGSDYLDALSNIKEIIFDKTGTITTGEFTSYEIKVIDNNYTKEDIIKYLVSGEVLSNHPIAVSITKLFKDSSKYKNITNFKEISGKGIEYDLKDKHIKIGSSTFCKSKNKDNAIYINIDNKNIASIMLYDGIKKEVKPLIKKLHNLGITTKIFTGDNKEYSLMVAKDIGIDDVYYELLPQDKFKLLEDEIAKYDNHVAFVGDGINDAPALARSSIGISLGTIGSASAIEASDVVIMNDDLNKIPVAIDLAKYTNKIIKENLIFALGTKLLVLILSAIGIASMWQAVFADTGLTLLTILNTTRILRRKTR